MLWSKAEVVPFWWYFGELDSHQTVLLAVNTGDLTYRTAYGFFGRDVSPYSKSSGGTFVSGHCTGSNRFARAGTGYLGLRTPATRQIFLRPMGEVST